MHRHNLFEADQQNEVTVSAFGQQKNTPKIIKVLARKPLEVEVRHQVNSSTKKQRFSSEDFTGFYSPTHHQYDVLQKGKIDLNKVLSRTPSSNKHQECKTGRVNCPQKMDQNSPATILVTKTPPTRSQLRVRLKLNEISNDTQYLKHIQRQHKADISIKLNSHVQPHTLKINQLEKQVTNLTEQNTRLREDNLRLLEVNYKVQQNMEDTLKRFMGRQAQEKQREDLIRLIQQQNSQLKAQNLYLTKSIQSKTEMAEYLEKELETALKKLKDIESLKEINSYSKLQDKINCMEDVIKEHQAQLQKQREKSKYLQIELQMLKQKRIELDSSKSIQQQRQRLIEKNKRLKRETCRLKNRLVERLQGDELFELSP